MTSLSAAAAGDAASSSSECIAQPASATSADATASRLTDCDTTSTIFVSIISYRDSETRHTVDSVYTRARHPERIYCGIVWQYHLDEDNELLFTDWNLDRYPSNHIRQVFMRHSEARGPCLARAIAMEQLYNAGCKRKNAVNGAATSKSLAPGEDFYLQIDSHMRFADDWDVEMLSQWRACEDEMAVLTAYPPGYERSSSNTSGSTRVWPPSNANDAPPMLCASHFDEKDGMLRFVGRLLKSPSATVTAPTASVVPFAHPLPCLYYAAGFTFSSSSLIHRVPYDPSLTNLFFGEETLMLARLWTHGFNMYLPRRNLIWHCWSREYRPSFRENATRMPPVEREKLRREEDRARRKVQRLLGMPPMENDTPKPSCEDDTSTDVTRYGLGTARTLAQFQAHVGVNFTTRTITDRARHGGLEPERFQAPPPASAAGSAASSASAAMDAQRKKQQLDLVMRLVMQQQKTGSAE